MYKYALATEIESNTYEIFDIINVPLNATVTIERVETALSSGKPIFGMKTTHFENKVSHGAIYDGTDLSGGNPDYYTNKPMVDWNYSDSFAMFCDNTIFFVMFNSKNTNVNDMYNAAFSQNVTMVKIQDDMDVALGDIWDGTQFSRNS